MAPVKALFWVAVIVTDAPEASVRASAVVAAPLLIPEISAPDTPTLRTSTDPASANVEPVRLVSAPVLTVSTPALPVTS